MPDFRALGVEVKKPGTTQVGNAGSSASRVTMLVRGPQLALCEDVDVAEELLRLFHDEGIDVRSQVIRFGLSFRDLQQIPIYGSRSAHHPNHP